MAAAAPEERRRLIDEAEELLGRLRTIDAAIARRNPPFDAFFFENELSQTRFWAFEKGGAEPLPTDQAALWKDLAGRMAREAAEPGPQGLLVPVHRDYHANNLMRAADGRLALIDFQDLRFGPRDYDGVSLRFERAGALLPLPAPGRYQDAVVLQRAWKVLGTFEKMLAKGRSVYTLHRDTARRVIRQCTPPGSAYAPLLPFLGSPSA